MFVTNWRRKWHDGFFIWPTSALFTKLWWWRRKKQFLLFSLCWLSFLPHKRDVVSCDFFRLVSLRNLSKTAIDTQFVIKRSIRLWSHVDTLLERENAFRQRLSGSMNPASWIETNFNHFFANDFFPAVFESINFAILANNCQFMSFLFFGR